MQAFSSILALFAISANGHMIMKTPVPYDTAHLNNSPLEATGGDFPCKKADYTSISKENTMPIGAPQTLSFTGSAVHGGGSCQISLTTDRAPTASSKWQVIHSIQGGCPANTDGNLGEDPNGSGASTFQFSIPQGIAPGKYSLAWTWFNHVGNREMYMNCAPVTVTGGSSKRDMMSQPISKKRDSPSFPDMFVANISPGCKFPDESAIVQFPVPGASVETVQGAKLTSPPAQCGQFGAGPNGASGGSSGSSSAGSGSGSGSGAGASPASSAPAATGSAQPASSPATSASAAPGGFASGAGSGTGGSSSSAGGSSPSTASAQPSASVVSPPAPASSGSSSGSSTNSSAGTGGAMSGPCTSEGDWYCSADGSSFQRCASGAWSPASPMASGTKCTPGQSSDLKMAGAKARRAHGGHVRRSHHAWGLSS